MEYKIPVILVHGSLGSGKTTLVKRLLGQRYFSGAFVIENEFASENVDMDTLKEDAHEDNFVGIAGGCICCSSGNELEDALNVIVEKKWNRPVIIETTGIANSAQLLQKLFLNPVFLENFELQKNILVIDPLETTEKELGTKELDIKLADIVLINKADLANSGFVELIKNAIAVISPQALIYATDRAFIDTDDLAMESGSHTEEAIARYFEEFGDDGMNDHGISYIVYEPSRLLSREAVEGVIKETRERSDIVLYRVKGNICNQAGEWWHIESTRHHDEWQNIGVKSKASLVFIGTGKIKDISGMLDGKKL
ncbi:MAG: GTP-binding protein [bacterium]|nr:GTP-binding protein [bacterium]MDZ4286258.1 GTP-binding protein [Candidatus Sungbacteria bacterium]